MTKDAAMTNTARAIARSFVDARRRAVALPAYPGTVPTSLADGYAIQDAALRIDGGRVAGWKVGRIWPPHEAMVGSNRLAGPIFAANVITAVGTATVAMPVFVGGFGAVEAEFIFVLGDVPTGQTQFSTADAAALVSGVHVGIEIASSPLAAINDLGPAVTVSDFGNNQGLIVGPPIADWTTAGFDDWPVGVDIDGAPVGSGVARDFPDGSLGSVRFLLELLGQRGIAVPPGTLVSTGAVSGVHAIGAGQRAEARFGDYARMACTIEAAVPDGG